MIFLEQFNFALRSFYVIGLKPAVPDGPHKRKLVDLIPVVVTSSLCGAFSILLIFFPHFNSYGIVFVLIYYGSLIPSFLMILTATGQCHFNHNDYKMILNQIGKLEKRFEEKSIRLSIKCVALRYKYKFVILYISFFVSQILVFVEVCTLHPGREWSSLLISSIRATYPVQLLHFVLYSDTVTMFLNQLNGKFNHSSIFVHRSMKIEFLKYVKLVHFELWKLVVGINNFFGWNLLFMTLFWFIHITHQVYWIFLNTHVNLKGLELFEGLASVSFGMMSLSTLVNTCESGLLEVKLLIENIEQYTFWTNDDVQLHQLKREILSQVLHLPINMSASRFFTIDRRFSTGVVASCCMYIVIFIQFYQTVEKV